MCNLNVFYKIVLISLHLLCVFCFRYIDAGFTKNIDKYIKYTPSDISNIIDTFFDAAA